MIPLDEPVSAFTTYLLTQGVLGICVAALAVAVVWLWRENGRLQQLRIDDAQAYVKARVEDQQKTLEKWSGTLEKTVTAIERSSEAAADLREAVRGAPR